VRVTHPFHPLYGLDFEFVAHRQNWGEDRVYLHDQNGHLFSLPAGWTDVAAPDLFAVVAAGRCSFTTDDLLAAAGLAGPGVPITYASKAIHGSRLRRGRAGGHGSGPDR
jgi:hypothetical protein